MKNIFLSLGILLLFNSCKPDDETPPKVTYGNFEIEFEHFWGHSHGSETAPSFKLNETLVCEETGDTVSFSQLKYYVSNIVLTNVTGSIFKEKESYHLLEFKNGEIPSITLDSIPSGEYTEISFLIGVDSTRNVSGAQEGDLSPTKEMFWTWNTGYRFIVAEGSLLSTNGNSGFVYHVGGFSGSNNALNQLKFPFEEKLKTNPYATPSVHLTVDVSAFWNNNFKLSSNKMIHMPGANAVTAAKNFADGIEIDHVHQ